MLKSSGRSVIRLRGVRHNNLKNFDLDLPLNQLIVITGLSGSGKSSLAFDTLFAEGQRRYIETFSPYARQFLDRMDKPQVDSIEGIPPAIAIEQRNSVRSTRSTVGTMTEICDYMKMLWPHIAQLHCRQCGQLVRKDSPQEVWEAVGPRSEVGGQRSELMITFELPLTAKLSLADSLALIAKQGYQRLLVGGQILRLEEVSTRITHHASRITSLTVLQDRLRPTPGNRARFVEACEQAYHFGKGKLAIRPVLPAGSAPQLSPVSPQLFSNRLHCAQCDIEYREPSPALFSFNHPVGACPACRGFGRVISIDYDLALPDRSKTLAEGVVRPWHTGHGLDSQRDLLRMCRHFEIPTDVPFEKLPKKWQTLVIEGEPDYGSDEEHEWPRAWYGVKGYFRWLESKAYKMHVRVMLSRYRAYTPCPDCGGKRFQPEALLYRTGDRSQEIRDRMEKSERSEPDRPKQKAEISGASLTLADFYLLPIRDALGFISGIADKHHSKANDPLGLVLNEVRSRLGFLDEVGLGYLTLDRPTRSLSGGETERVNLTTCLGTRLVNTLFVLDEPSVGLHSRDTERLVQILQRLRDAGNTVVVVEHEASVMRAANQIVDLGPGHGATGGQVVFQGSFASILKSAESITGQYLSGRKGIEVLRRRPVGGRRSRVEGRGSKVEAGSVMRDAWCVESEESAYQAVALNDALMPTRYGDGGGPVLKLSGATLHNLKDLTVEIPLNRFVCVTGVSGSGKTTLVREILMPALAARLKSSAAVSKASDRLATAENGAAEEDDSALRTPHSALLEGCENLGAVVLVDQSLLGKTPRSNPAVYIGAFDDIREVFAQSEPARQRGLNASAFSFNSTQGQCERCRGAGFEKIEMQFLSDVFIKCPDCNGRRYREHILKVKISPESKVRSPKSRARGQKSGVRSQSSVSIADLLEATVEEAIEFLGGFPESRAARRAAESLELLQEVGLGYLKLGQPINTLSGGESQRLKLVRHLAEAGGQVGGGVSEKVGESGSGRIPANSPTHPLTHLPTLFLFDEPTTGLHFDDVRVLLKVFQRLVDAGHSVVVIEHNLDVIKSADWVIDLGPEAGDQGGQVVAAGTPENVSECAESHTGKALREVLALAKTRIPPRGGKASSSKIQHPELCSTKLT
jgi:excinuclease ABC subunit A